ncbi:hypothetical protein EYF80_050756 [Liparis tanakae]|uniref:Uncharacterized protein n=1 Tax=Liparis tanakae TaxID=230148 RepID=A0A4Z2FD21_9TELE|nr:hypothetical protein EYF80_050756 [Liparis tanakae]
MMPPVMATRDLRSFSLPPQVVHFIPMQATPRPATDTMMPTIIKARVQVLHEDHRARDAPPYTEEDQILTVELQDGVVDLTLELPAHDIHSPWYMATAVMMLSPMYADIFHCGRIVPMISPTMPSNDRKKPNS